MWHVTNINVSENNNSDEQFYTMPLDLGPPLALKEQKSIILLLLITTNYLITAFRLYNFFLCISEIKMRYQFAIILNISQANPFFLYLSATVRKAWA